MKIGFRSGKLFNLSPNFLLSLLFFIGGILWTISLCLRSPGTPVQDEIGHLLISHHAWGDPELILQIWGRPVNTLIFMIPALGGLLWARLFSIFLSTLTVIFTMRVLQKLGVRHYFWVPLLFWFQPWVNDLSYTAITEVPFSLFLILSIFLSLGKNDRWAAVIIGLLPLIRYEGIVLTGFFCLYFLYRRDWKAVIISSTPILIYNLIYYLVFKALPIDIYLNPQTTTFYGQGSWLHFVRPLITGVGIIIVVLCLLGIPTLCLHRKKILIFLPFLVYFIIQTIVFHYGLYASGGYELFLLPLAPGIALLSALGATSLLKSLQWLQEHIINSQLAKSIPVLIMICCVAIILYIGTKTQPRPADIEQTTMLQVANWLMANGYSPEIIVSTHVWLNYYDDLPWQKGHTWASPPAMATFTTDSIFVWDSHYSERWGFPLAILSDPTYGWKKLAEFGGGSAIVFQR